MRAPDRGTHYAWRDMHGTQFAQFSAEVLRRGAAAVLPQHLPDRWLDALLEEADLLAPGTWGPEEEARVQECGAGLLGAVLVVRMEQRGHPAQLEVTVSTLMHHLHCYILALAAERVSRDTDIWLEPPTLANLFDEAREVRGRRRAAEGCSTSASWRRHGGCAVMGGAWELSQPACRGLHVCAITCRPACRCG